MLRRVLGLTSCGVVLEETKHFDVVGDIAVVSLGARFREGPSLQQLPG